MPKADKTQEQPPQDIKKVATEPPSMPRSDIDLLESLLDDLRFHLGRHGAPKAVLARITDMKEPIRYARSVKK